MFDWLRRSRSRSEREPASCTSDVSAASIPLTSKVLTGDVLESHQCGILTSDDLNAWAEELLLDGRDSDAIVFAAANSDLDWQDVRRLFAAICRDLGLSDNLEDEIESIKRRVWIEEYRQGQRSGSELLHKFDDLRREIGFPEQPYLRLIPDNADGTNDSGYYGGDSWIHGEELELAAQKYLSRAGIRFCPQEGPANAVRRALRFGRCADR